MDFQKASAKVPPSAPQNLTPLPSPGAVVTVTWETGALLSSIPLQEKEQDRPAWTWTGLQYALSRAAAGNPQTPVIRQQWPGLDSNTSKGPQEDLSPTVLTTSSLAA